MSAKMAIAFLLVCLTFSGQQRFEEGEFKGFTRSPTEYIINRYKITVHDGSREPLEDVLVEVRGPGKSEVVRGVRTDRSGQFRFRRLRQGIYVFKITRDGFQSLVGELKTGPSAAPTTIMKFTLKVGV